MKLWIGIDPGKNGSLCAIDEDNKCTFIDFKTKGLYGYIDFIKTIKADNTKKIETFFIEQVASMPGQGVKSMFSFGQRFGELEGMLQALEVGYQTVRPRIWQKNIGIKPKSSKKEIAITIKKVYPDAKFDGPRGGLLDGRADALGIAHYGK